MQGGEALAGARIPGEQGREQKALELMPFPEEELNGERLGPSGYCHPQLLASSWAHPSIPSWAKAFPSSPVTVALR